MLTCKNYLHEKHVKNHKLFPEVMKGADACVASHLEVS